MGKLLNWFKIQTYNVGFIKKNPADILGKSLESGDIVWVKHRYKDRFFADPFLIDEDLNYYYILVEEYPFYTEKGFISMLTVSKETSKLIAKKKIIEEPWHLSFPFCEFKGNYIIPEACRSGISTKYLFDLEKKEVTGKEIIFQEGLIDTVFYKNYALTAKLDSPKEKMFLLKENNGKFINLNGGKPIVESPSISRLAGSVFALNNDLYVPTQDCVDRYGKQVIINKLIELNDGGIKLENVSNFSSFNNHPYDETMHTFNVYDSLIVVDGSKDFMRFPAKFFYKIIKKIKKK